MDFFSYFLNENLSFPINVRSSCPTCGKKIQFKDILKIIKLPDILILQ